MVPPKIGRSAHSQAPVRSLIVPDGENSGPSGALGGVIGCAVPTPFGAVADADADRKLASPEAQDHARRFAYRSKVQNIRASPTDRCASLSP